MVLLNGSYGSSSFAFAFLLHVFILLHAAINFEEFDISVGTLFNLPFFITSMNIMEESKSSSMIVYFFAHFGFCPKRIFLNQILFI